jgi:hypothetical protein
MLSSLSSRGVQANLKWEEISSVQNSFQRQSAAAVVQSAECFATAVDIRQSNESEFDFISTLEIDFHLNF